MSNETGSLWVVFNGEIFNYRELRSELEQRGHRFTTQSDTEVILHAYETFGVECVQRFNGMFKLSQLPIRNAEMTVGVDIAGKLFDGFLELFRGAFKVFLSKFYQTVFQVRLSASACLAAAPAADKHEQ